MDLLVAADDRTGALETAGALADRLGTPVAVTAWPSRSTEAISVIDLGTRHLTPVDARLRVDGLPPVGRAAHKIDSTLRGNWAEEIATLADRRPVLLIPALPALGRTCVDGTVLDHGRPVHQGDAGTDVRRRVITSRPAESLAAAGRPDVAELRDLDGVRTWLQDPDGVVVADAADEAAIDALVAAWSDGPPSVVLAGTSAVIAAVAGGGVAPSRPVTDGPVLVVCGSVHPAARAQIAAAEAAGIVVTHIPDDVTARQLERRGELVLASEIPVGDVDEPMAIAAATTLARGVDELRRRVGLGSLVVIGGDTAAAVLGDVEVLVRGTVGPGTAWVDVDGMSETVVTRSGGFGSEHALIELVRTTLRP